MQYVQTIESPFYRKFCGNGRSYALGKEIYTRYTGTSKIKKHIKENIRNYIFVDSAVRITVDSQDSEPERLIISTPFHVNDDRIVTNLAELIFLNLQSYYLTADPKINHYGVSNTILEGFDSSGLRRELELICHRVSSRVDIAGRVLQGINFEESEIIPEKKFVFSEVIQQRIDIHMGYRIVLYGPRVNSQSFFVPILIDSLGVIDKIYRNLEMILHHNFVSYDDLAEHGYLRLSNNLIMKELLALLRRAKNKENVRKKIINGIKFSTVMTNDPLKRYGELAGDYINDTINQIDNKSLMEASDRSRALYDTFSFNLSSDVENSANYKSISGFEEIIMSRTDSGEATSAPVYQPQETVAMSSVEETVAEQPSSSVDSGESFSLEDDDLGLEEI